MLMFAIVAVFIAGLMVGRTPEYLGKKIEAYEIKMAALVHPGAPRRVLLGTAVAVMVPRPAWPAWPTPAPMASRGPVRLLVGRQQQRQRVRRPVGQHPLLQLHARAGDAGSRATG
jgi:hypothetical protein